MYIHTSWYILQIPKLQGIRENLISIQKGETSCLLIRLAMNISSAMLEDRLASKDQ